MSPTSIALCAILALTLLVGTVTSSPFLRRRLLSNEVPAGEVDYINGNEDYAVQAIIREIRSLDEPEHLTRLRRSIPMMQVWRDSAYGRNAGRTHYGRRRHHRRHHNTRRHNFDRYGGGVLARS